MTIRVKNHAQILDSSGSWSVDLAGIKLIEASAGTGKTWTIANLYLRHIIEGRDVGDILIVTFTNAATQELKGRIRKRLDQALQLLVTGEPAADDFIGKFLQRVLELPEKEAEQVKQRLKLAVRTMDEAAIYTIHGFCQRALVEYAFHSGQQFSQALLVDDSDLWQTAIEDWWRKQTYTREPSSLALLKRSLVNLKTFRSQLKALAGNAPRQLVPEIPADLESLIDAWLMLEPRLVSLGAEWTARREEILKILYESPALSRTLGNGYQPADLDAAVSAFNAFFSSPGLDNVPESLHMLSIRHLDANSTAKKRGTDPQLADRFFASCQIVLDEMQAIEHQVRIVALVDAAAWTRDQVEQAKEKAGILSYDDLLTRLNNALMASRGDLLADKLRARFPVAMIDEFQDTDATQYNIFRTLYADRSDTSLILIGDPKQAIYSFRGGDIFTYMRAKLDAGEQTFTLATNWRSAADLIKAVNAVFMHRKAPFVYEDAIGFQEVSAPEVVESAVLREKGSILKPLVMWQIPLADNAKPLGKAKVEDLLNQVIADEVTRLVEGGRQGSLTLGEVPVRPGDMAILVRTGYEGQKLRAVLLDRGVNAVTVGHERVFQSSEALGLMQILKAVVRYQERSCLRSALASDLLNYSYLEIAGIVDQETAWFDWSLGIRTLHKLWSQKGFMSMFQYLLQGLGVGERLILQDDAERRMTNLLQLSEILQQQSKQQAGPEALLGWFSQQMLEGGDDETELRLESDEALVKIVTIHSSKGLEFPIVFAPFLWSCKPVATGANWLLPFHDSDGKAWFDCGSDDLQQHLLLAEKERLAEDVRLAYVALTRARSRVYTAWGRIKSSQFSSGRSGFAYLLHEEQSPEDLDQTPPDVFLNLDDIQPDLEKLVDESGGLIDLVDLAGYDVSARKIERSHESSTLVSGEFCRTLANDWRISSFSGMTRDIHQAPHGGSPRQGLDRILDFPAGADIGLFLHQVLEHLDFQSDLDSQTAELAARFAPRFNLELDAHLATLSAWISHIVKTPLDSTGLSLDLIPRAQRLDELAFDFSIDLLDIDALNRALSQAAGQPLARITRDDFRGLITGFIDMVFEYRGKYYIVDYKSNFLGGSLDDYAPERLRRAVFDRRYDLQYLLYTLALHRYLSQRLVSYDYGRHFGGVFYLFLRGMREDSGQERGVYFDLPDPALIHALDHKLLAAPDKRIRP